MRIGPNVAGTLMIANPGFGRVSDDGRTVLLVILGRNLFWIDRTGLTDASIGQQPWPLLLLCCSRPFVIQSQLARWKCPSTLVEPRAVGSGWLSPL